MTTTRERLALFLPLLAAMGATAALRLHFAGSLFPKGDALTLALMADDIARGAAFPLLYYGQNYMGSIEAWLTAPLFLLFGPSWWGVAFAPVAMTVVGVIPVWLAAETMAGRRAGWYAVALWTVGLTFGALFYQITPRGCYPEILAGEALLFWHMARTRRGDPVGVGGSLAVGLAAGLLLWTTLLALPVLAVLGAVTLLEGRELFSKRTGALVAGGLPGLALFLVIAASLAGDDTARATLEGLGDRAAGFLTTYRDLFIPGPRANAPGWMVGLGWLALALTTTAFLAETARALWLLVRPAPGEKRGGASAPMVVTAYLFIVLYLLNAKSADGAERHILPLLTPLTLGLAMALARFIPLPLAVAALLLVAGGSLTKSAILFSLIGEASVTARERMEALEEGLRSRGITAVTGLDYDLALRMNWDGRTGNGPWQAMTREGARSLSDLLAADRAQGGTMAFFRTTPEEVAVQYRACCGDDFEIFRIAEILFLKPGRLPNRDARSIPPSEWIIDADLAPMADRVFSTIRSSGDGFTLRFARPVKLAKVRAIFGERLPRRLGLSVERGSGIWQESVPPKPASLIYPSGGKLFRRSGYRVEREFEEWIVEPPVVTTALRFDTEGEMPPFDLHEL
ncbi:MAG: hypothetical protein HQK87_06525, partial [Nitrospinae bacterium]|nr:hypothetical protein [Nitrospinota bacterium]